MIGIIFTDTIEELQLKSMGYHHDHCRRIFFGKTVEICDEYKYKYLMVNEKEYCFIYDEDEPYIPKKK